MAIKKCPNPNCKGKPRVIDTRVSDDVYLRRYNCPACGTRFNSGEVLIEDSIRLGAKVVDEDQMELELAA